ncbi:hypothetical protein K227x_64160 [Rubripirellula lacrimiformis]|uniref:Uncharacterized protein n=1 Tax=Rubripirellula lacrimiformis TaxID=1930273 RepID=A0A517NLH5_9BACT|nr:hypothetical protein [Rubripirellula lacrimiformis]QDT07986.1 hypothetical protein K227x_64160 [Rubripirellula lacrimiformis]
MVIADPDWLTRSVAKIDAGSVAVQLVGSLSYLDQNRVGSVSVNSGMFNLMESGKTAGNPGGAATVRPTKLRKMHETGRLTQMLSYRDCIPRLDRP